MTDTELVWAVLGGHHGFNVVEFDFDGERRRSWVPVRFRRPFVYLIGKYGPDGDLRVSAGPFHDFGSLRLAGLRGCVWARVETPAAARKLAAFRPEPTVLLHESGSRYVALWGLTKALWPEQAAKVNRHIAHHLGGPKKWSEQLVFAPPGVVMRDRKRPVVVTVAGGSREPYGVAEVCRRLPRRIPDPSAWKNAS